jgi:phage minor structural protein
LLKSRLSIILKGGINLNYPIVYDCKTTDFNNHGLAVLENASNVKVKEVINGEFLLSFILPRTDPKWQYIVEENFVKVYDASQKKDQLFRIRTTEEQRDNTGKLTSNVQCEHVYYDAHDCAFFPTFEMIGETPEAILTAAFAGTRFTVGTVEITTLTDIIQEKAYPHGILTQLIENVGGELVKDNWTIHLLIKRGVNTGVQFRVGKNIKGIKKHKDGQHVITRLYPYGKDGMQIPGALGYIDSPLINNYDRPKIGHMDYKDIEDPDELLASGIAEWSTADVDGIDKPRVTYSGDFLELKKLKEYGEAEAYGIGDIVKIVDTDLNIDTNQRIMEYENYPYEPKPSMVALSNTNPKVYRDNRPLNVFSGAFRTTEYISEITDSSKKLNPSWFQNIKRKLQTVFNGGLRDAVMHKTGDIWVDDPANPTKAMGILADGFAIANSKKANGDWDWKTFGTAEGFFADLMIAGVLMISDNLTISNADGSLKITGSEMSFVKTDMKNKIIINLASGMKIQKNIGTTEEPVWEDVNYQDTNGNNILKGFIIASKFMGSTVDSAYIEIGTGGGGNLGDLKLFRGTGGGEHPVFSVFDDITIIELRAGTAASAPVVFLRVSPVARYPQGEWNCDNATFTYLNDGSSYYATKEWVEANFSPIDHSHA